MGVQRLEDLRAFTLAVQFKLAAYQLVRQHPAADADSRFRSQLFDAAASVEMNIAEGWRRHAAGEFCHFLKYSRASLEEAERWIHDGVARGYYPAHATADALQLADQCGRTTMALWRSLQPFAKRRR